MNKIIGYICVIYMCYIYVLYICVSIVLQFFFSEAVGLYTYHRIGWCQRTDLCHWINYAIGLIGVIGLVGVKGLIYAIGLTMPKD